MIIPAIGYVPLWMIALPVCIVGSILTVINIRFRDRVSGAERGFTRMNFGLARLFSKLSNVLRGLQADVLNRDIMMLALGILLLFAVYFFRGGLP